MKKILFGFLGIFLVIGIVAGTGYALFSSKASVTGMVLGTATPSLQISFLDKTTGLPVEYKSTLSFEGQTFAPLLPGEEDWGAFFLKNSSNGTTDKLDFNLTGKITAVNMNDNWYALKDVIKMKVCVLKIGAENYCDTDVQTSWYTIDQWFSSPKALPGGALLQTTPDNERGYVVVFSIHESYGNDISGKSITGMTMEVTGTQVP